MLAIFLKTIPFFLLIGLGYLAAKWRFFSAEGTVYLTKFVFYFALSAMLFNFAATLEVGEIFDGRFVLAYLGGTLSVYLLATIVAGLRGVGMAEAAVEAQVAAIGNVGFLGLPMLVVLLGEAAAGPVLMVLATDLIVFSSLIVILITASREGKIGVALVGNLILGLLKNPMIVSIASGLLWSMTGLHLPIPIEETLSILGAAATPGALFAIGASLAVKSAERVEIAGWLAFCKLALHPGFVALFALVLIPVDPYAALVMVSAAALPVAGNVYILAQHYGVAPQRVSAAILISTSVSIVTVSLIIGWLSTGVL